MWLLFIIIGNIGKYKDSKAMRQQITQCLGNV